MGFSPAKNGPPRSPSNASVFSSVASKSRRATGWPELRKRNAARDDGRVIRGKISKVNKGLEKFLLDTKSGKQVTVRPHGKTKFFVDGSAATFDDLDVGQKARVRGRFAKDHDGDTFLRARAVRAKTPGL